MLYSMNDWPIMKFLVGASRDRVGIKLALKMAKKKIQILVACQAVSRRTSYEWYETYDSVISIFERFGITPGHTMRILQAYGVIIPGSHSLMLGMTSQLNLTRNYRHGKSKQTERSPEEQKSNVSGQSENPFSCSG